MKTADKTVKWLKGFDELLGNGEHNNHDGIRSAIYHLENSNKEIKDLIDEMIEEYRTKHSTAFLNGEIWIAKIKALTELRGKL